MGRTNLEALAEMQAEVVGMEPATGIMRCAHQTPRGAR